MSAQASIVQIITVAKPAPTAAGSMLRFAPGGMVDESGPCIPPFPVVDVAGPHESKAPGIQVRVRQVMPMVLKPLFYPLGAE